jgi:MEMO1 family protein
MKYCKGIYLFLVFLFVLSLNSFTQDTKLCEFAGSFYPQDPQELSTMIDEFIGQAKIEPVKRTIIGIISPHAGYIYSGSVAAYGYKELIGQKFDTVVIMGILHHRHLRGIAVYKQGYFQTPLGSLEVDSQLADKFSSLSFAQFDQSYFYGEHSVEVELPFIQRVLPGIKIVPVIFGNDLSYQEISQVAQLLKALSEKKKILVIASSDMSHYLEYQKANALDFQTIGFIKNKNEISMWAGYQLDENRACGILPISAFMRYAQLRSADISVLKYANSGDTAGDKSSVVGYMSALVCLDEPKSKGGQMGGYTLTKEEKSELLKIARQTLESYLKNGKVPKFEKPKSEALNAKRGAFVTLKENGQLRGCIGRIVGDTPVYQVVSDFAINAAVEDPRFEPVNYSELKNIEIEISVLTPFEKVKDLGEIEVGRHGLMIQKGFSSGLLLPQVPTEEGWDKKTFLEYLCRKAGLNGQDYKDKDAIIYKFEAIVFNEDQLDKEN